MTVLRSAPARSWWKRSVSRRIGVVMLMTIVFTLVAAVASLRGLSTLSHRLEQTLVAQTRSDELVASMLEASRQLSDAAKRAAAAATDAERAAALAELDSSKRVLGERIDEISAQLGDAPELQKALQEGFSSFVISAVKASRLLQAGRQQDAERELLTSFDPKLLSYVLMTISGVTQHTQLSVKVVAEDGRTTYDRTLMLLVPMLLGVALAIAVGHLLLRRTVIKPVRRVAQAAEQLAQGRFDLDLTTTSQDECGEMLQAMASLREQLARMIEIIGTASQSVAGTADELADSNQQLASRSNAQASALRQAAAALESLNAMAKLSASNAQRVSRDMQQALGSAQQGRTVISRVVSTMQATEQASRKIGAAIGMIDEIAFKTNILSLNAAVEAARAGEHGRSFAVVASEVRTLASKSATAAKEIESLIATSTATVTEGAKLVADAGVAIENIVRQMQAAADHMAEISSASHEQSRRAEEVTGAIGEIDNDTRSNASMAAQAAASTETLRNEARTLTGSVAGFVQNRNDETSSTHVESAASDRPRRAA
jgi:methyl-accepting chemotaxis protein